MKKRYKNCIHLILILLLLLNCQKNDSSNTSVQKAKNLNTIRNSHGDRLKTGINLSASFLDHLEFKKYRYNDEFIEDLKLSSFENKIFRNDFFKYLISRDLDQNQSEQVFFIKLLLVRIQQNDDLISFDLLSSVFNDTDLSYYLEDYDLELFQLFLYKPYFFIQGEYKYKQSELNSYINKNLPSALLTNKKQLDDVIIEIDLQEDALLLKKEVTDRFTIADLRRNITDESSQIEGYLSPSYENNWKSETVTYFNILKYLHKATTGKLDKNEKLLFESKYGAFFKNYIIKAHQAQYHIDDPDGYTNLRKEANIKSDVLQRITSGAKIEVLNNSGEWFLIKTKEGKEGYIHKSRVKTGN